MKQHGRDNFYVVGEGVYTTGREEVSVLSEPSTLAALRKFRFSRLGPKADPVDDTQRQINEKIADAMTTPDVPDPDSDPGVPAGYTYLGQFVDHDLTADNTAVHLGEDVTVAELVQGRSPALDLDSLYGLGPQREPRFYESDGVRLRLGTTAGVGFPPNDPVANTDQAGFDLPRAGEGSNPAERRAPVIPDARNDENLAVAQTHLMFMKFHNAVVAKLVEEGTPSAVLFDTARETVVKHYQWMLRHDFLPRIVESTIVEDVFNNGRRFFELPRPYEMSEDLYRVRRGPKAGRFVQPGDTPTMPVEFSVGAYRVGHSMVRGAYQWNKVFRSGGVGGIASLGLLFRFTGTSGNLAPGPDDDFSDINDPNTPGGERLPSNWIADFRRLYDFNDADRPDLVPDDGVNLAKRIDTLLVDPLRLLPRGSFGGRKDLPGAVGRALNLAFRNLTRAGMVRLATGQQMAELLEVEPLKPDAILTGNGGAVLPSSSDGQSGLTDDQKNFLAENTPLWFYILREAELGNGRLTGVGGRIVVEVFHRAMEGSANSIVRDPSWRPTLVPDDVFRMAHLLLVAVAGRDSDLFPLG